MAAIPHSGNHCSGLCARSPDPCGHEGCWQCDDIVKASAEALVKAAERKRRSKTDPLLADPLAEAAGKLGKAAAITFNDIVAEMMAKPLPLSMKQANKQLQSEIERITEEKTRIANEQARNVLKAQGASDEDIAAAEAILGWKPPEPTMVEATKIEYRSMDITQLINQYRKGW